MDRSVGHRGISRTGEQRCRSCVGSCTAGSSSRRAATDRGLWWRAVNERLLRDGCESVALTGHLPGPPTSPTVELWMRFIRRPTGRTWYRAHNASVVTRVPRAPGAGRSRERRRTLLHERRALPSPLRPCAQRCARSLARMATAPRSSPRGSATRHDRDLPASFPRAPYAYPLTGDVSSYLGDELSFGRAIDFGIIQPRLQYLYEWSATELNTPGLTDCIHEGSLTYAWPYEVRTCGPKTDRLPWCVSPVACSLHHPPIARTLRGERLLARLRQLEASCPGGPGPPHCRA